jgi:hypothetical protein
MPPWSARRYLFVLGHMRSYSSLLCHILGSHPQIDGYCETHVKYRTRLDLIRLRSRVVKLTGEPLHGRYVLEKMLHNYAFAPSILRSPRTFALVSIRQPIAAVQSIVNMGLHYGAVAWHRDLDAVVRYYEERLAMLVRLADELRGRVMFMEAEALLSQTADVLQGIGDLLDLGEPLRSDYRRFAHTGEGGFGDPSETITTGRVSNATRELRTPVIIPEALISRLEMAYATCLAALRERCMPLEAAAGRQGQAGSGFAARASSRSS